MSEAEVSSAKVVAVVACDLVRSPIGTASRLERPLAGRAVILRMLDRLRAVAGVDEIVLLAPTDQMERIEALASSAHSLNNLHAHPIPGVGQPCIIRVLPLTPRPAKLDARVTAGRAWSLQSWRGGAGQWTVFDEDYHPVAIGEVVKATGAGHILCIPAHAPFLDAAMTSALVQHHLHKNHEMRLTYTPAAPGLSGILLRADMALEMAEKTVLPGQLLGYDPRLPTFDTLIREACMQVDPALSKIPNRFLVDTDRDWAIAEKIAATAFDSPATLAIAAAELRGQGLGFGVRGDGLFAQPRELELELTPRRLTAPPGSVPREIREKRGELDPSHWIAWLARQHFADDLLLTLCGDGDPVMYAGLPEIAAAARAAGARQIHVQTDLAADISALAAAINAGNIAVLSVQFYGDDAETYAKVSGIDFHSTVMKNLESLQEVVNRVGLPLVVPRLLKVRETIPQMEAFFDRWVLNASWAVIDGPTDRAGAVPFAGVVDMAPPKRKACRRIAERMVIRADGSAVACDQDILGKLSLGHIERHSLEEMCRGTAMASLRQMHVAGRWAEVSPCATCREWHRA